MLASDKNKQQACEMCYRIICGGCGWIAADEDVLKIQKEEMTACPLCGWQPARRVPGVAKA